MKRLTDNAEAQKRMEILIKEIEVQSDRGVGIVGAAWLEEIITVSIEGFLQQAPKAWERLFKGNGALATFSAKIDLVRLLGLVSETIRSDLHIIREIRNEFAHQITHKADHTKLGFHSLHIRDKCMAIQCIAHEKHANPRTAFIRACTILTTDFETQAMFGTKVTDADAVLIFARVENKSR